ncbi:hypothetical protein V6N13_133733 [Hibiscus sabdariffa]
MDTGGFTTNLNNHLKTCLNTPQGNTADFKQSELAFAKTTIDPETGDGVPTFDDWENVRRIAKVLEPFYDLTLKIVEIWT